MILREAQQENQPAEAPSSKAQAGECVGQPHRLVHWVSHGLGTTDKAGPFSNCGSDENPGNNMAFIF